MSWLKAFSVSTCFKNKKPLKGFKKQILFAGFYQNNRLALYSTTFPYVVAINLLLLKGKFTNNQQINTKNLTVQTKNSRISINLLCRFYGCTQQSRVPQWRSAPFWSQWPDLVTSDHVQNSSPERSIESTTSCQI